MDFNLLFKELPYLENDLLYTKKITTIDAEEFTQIYLNPNCFKYTPGSACKTKQAAINIINHYERDYLKKRFFKIGLYLKETNKLIGILEVFNFNKKNNEVEIGYRLNELFWNKDYGTYGVQLLINYLLNIIKVENIIATIMIENIASNKIIQKCGFTLIKQTLQETIWKDKGLVNLNIYKRKKDCIIYNPFC